MFLQNIGSIVAEYPVIHVQELNSENNEKKFIFSFLLHNCIVYTVTVGALSIIGVVHSGISDLD